MLTDPHDFVLDPFAGSCITGEVAERLGRNWACCDIVEDYLHGALGRFHDADAPSQKPLFARGRTAATKTFTAFIIRDLSGTKTRKANCKRMAG